MTAGRKSAKIESSDGAATGLPPAIFFGGNFRSMEFLTTFLPKALQITLIDLVLSGDNVGIIALAIRRLQPKTARRAKAVGVGGAVLLRIVFVMLISALLSVSSLHINFFGGFLLLFITWNMLRSGSNENPKKVRTGSGFLSAVASIIIADASMSLDNVLAISSIAMKNTNYARPGIPEFSLIVFGLVLCIPVIFFGSGLVAKLMNRFPIVIYICAGILVDTALKMIVEDHWVAPHMGGAGEIAAIVLGVLTFAWGLFKLFVLDRRVHPVKKLHRKEKP